MDKQCSKCERVLPEVDFYNTCTWCRDCHRAYYRTYMKEYRERHAKAKRFDTEANIAWLGAIPVYSDGAYMCGNCGSELINDTDTKYCDQCGYKVNFGRKDYKRF